MSPDANGHNQPAPAFLLQLVAWDAETQQGQLSLSHTLPGGWAQAHLLLCDALKKVGEQMLLEQRQAAKVAQQRLIALPPWPEG